MLSSTSELSQLLARVGGGDKAAFADLYAATSAKLYGIILRILRRRDLADEILQEVYVRIWQNAASFEPGRASPITWMATIARNRALDEVRKARPVLSEYDDAYLEVPDEAPLALEQLERSEVAKRLTDCLDGLEDERRVAVTMAYLDGCSRLELAERLGKPVNTIKTWLHRSLKQLKDCLGP